MPNGEALTDAEQKEIDDAVEAEKAAEDAEIAEEVRTVTKYRILLLNIEYCY